MFQLQEMTEARVASVTNRVERHALATAHEGWTLSVDDGIDDTIPMVFGGAKIDKFNVEAKQGGTIVLRFRIGTSDVDAEKLGKLAMHNGQSIWITLVAPKPAERAIDGSNEAFANDHPDAGDLFARDHGGPEDEGDADSEGGETVAPVDVQIEQSRPGTRTARGRERTKKALAAGATS